MRKHCHQEHMLGVAISFNDMKFKLKEDVQWQVWFFRGQDSETIKRKRIWNNQ